MRFAIALALVCAACKSKPAHIVDAASPVTDAGVDAAIIVDAASDATRVLHAGPPSIRTSSVDAVAVSSRVDNATETPYALVDGDLDTAWSSRTGDLVGAWVALRIHDRRDVLTGVEMTVGMTKDADLFQQNVRISEVSVSLSDVVLVDHFKLDTESRALQTIPISAAGPGILKITVQAVKMGTKTSWRETTISEIKLVDAKGELAISAFEFSVGSFEPKARGILGIIPERRAPLGCLAALPSVPRAYCVLGAWGNVSGRTAEVMTVDKDGAQSIAPLAKDAPIDALVPYDIWLRVERELRGGVTFGPKDPLTDIPWNGSVDVGGVTFRQRETTHTHDTEGPDMINGVLEVKFPGTSTFTEVFGETAPAATANMIGTLRAVGSMWLLERDMSHGSEGWYASEAEAVMCTLQAKHCGAFTMPAAPPDTQ